MSLNRHSNLTVAISGSNAVILVSSSVFVVSAKANLFSISAALATRILSLVISVLFSCSLAVAVCRAARMFVASCSTRQPQSNPPLVTVDSPKPRLSSLQSLLERSPKPLYSPSMHPPTRPFSLLHLQHSSASSSLPLSAPSLGPSRLVPLLWLLPI